MPKNSKTVLWENIEALMTAKGTNARRVAALAKVSSATVHKLKDKSVSPRLDVMDAIARVLGVPTWRLLKPPAEPVELDYTEEAMEIAALFDAMPRDTPRAELERQKASAVVRLVLSEPTAPVAPEPAPAPTAPQSAKPAPVPSPVPRGKR